MSQLTLNGIIDPVPEKPGLKEIPAPEIPVESWYKGRVLSHSSIGLYKGCPQRWKFRYIDKVPEKPKSFFSFGKSVHAGLEFLFEKISEPLPALDTLLTKYKDGWLREGYETAAQEKWFYQEGERILRGFYAKHQNDRKRVKQVEYKFSVSIEGVPLIGYIDRIDETAAGGLAIIDYKTGKAFDKARVRTDAQLTLYQIACQQVFQKPVETLTLYHLNSLSPLTVPAHSKKMEDNLKENIVEAAKGISEGRFDPRPDERGQCQWCDYMQICPAFSGKTSTTMTGTAPAPADVAEKADRLGKLDTKIGELIAERQGLQQELGSMMRATDRQEIQGRHFRVKREKTDDSAEHLSTEPSSTETAD